MRFEGTIKSWNEERAFGFIEPSQGGQEIFVHITALPARAGRPALNQRVSFELELNAEGKKRAKNVQLVRPARTPPSRTPKPANTWGGATLFVVPAFATLYFGLNLLWRIPGLVAGAYVGLSILCFAMYAADKSAARSGGWRTQESTLLLLGLLGGWPGAILAQQFLRHKSAKASFRSAFWGTVLLNVGLFIALSSPWMDAWKRLV
ncbi:MAG: DUF1294 domain-containing protein [Hylemonella sp.]